MLGDGGLHLVTIATDPASAQPVDAFALGDALLRRGWYHDRQGPPDSLHATVSAGNAPVIEEWVADLAASVAEVSGVSATDRGTSYSTVE